MVEDDVLFNAALFILVVALILWILGLDNGAWIAHGSRVCNYYV